MGKEDNWDFVIEYVDYKYLEYRRFFEFIIVYD